MRVLNAEVLDEKESRRSNMLTEYSEHLLILARDVNRQAMYLREILSPYFASVSIIIDHPPIATTSSDCGSFVIHIGDEYLAGLERVTSRMLGDRPYTAWSRALHFAMNHFGQTDVVWFMEDDVAVQAHTLMRLQQRSAELKADFSSIAIALRECSSDWPWWKDFSELAEPALKSFNPLCRCSGRLLCHLREFLFQEGRLFFHEICLPTVAFRAGLQLFDWSTDPVTRSCFGSFYFRPILNQLQYGICHPVKDADLHEKICSMPDFVMLDEAESAFCAIGENEATFGEWSIDRMEFRWLARWCEENRIRRVIEFGPGVSTFVWIGAGCRVHAYESSPSWLNQHRMQIRNRCEIFLLPEADLPPMNELPWVPDVVMVDGPPFRAGQRFSRRAQCAWAMELCGRFFLHDSHRSGEMETLKDYQNENYHILQVPSKKGLVLVTDRRRHEISESFVDSAHCVAQYQGLKAWGWYLRDSMRWQYWLKTTKKVRAMEIGAFDGISACLMLDLLFLHPESTVDAIDPYLPDVTTPEVSCQTIETFRANRCQGGYENRIRLHEGMSVNVLAWMINEPEYQEGFDFIYVDGSHLAQLVLTDAVLCMQLLKKGGIMIFDDYGKKSNGVAGNCPALALDAFLKIFEGKVKVFEKGWKLGLIRC